MEGRLLNRGPKRLIRVASLLFLVVHTLGAEPPLLKFEAWGNAAPESKVLLYVGWANGFIQFRGAIVAPFVQCIQDISIAQAVAVIDKRWRENPEKWSEPIGEQLLAALTSGAGPCKGTDPFSK